jgi:hypothetical protein
MTDLMRYWSVICSISRLNSDISRKLIGGKAVVLGVGTALIWALFSLYFYRIGFV